MVEHIHKPEYDGEKVRKPQRVTPDQAAGPAHELTGQSSAGGAQVRRLLNLQQTAGNRAVVGTVQRHSKGITDMVMFRVKVKKDGHETWMSSGN